MFSQGTAGAGSLILEFATLSRLTGDDRFEKAAYKAFFAIWNRKSDVGLVGNTINIWNGVNFVTHNIVCQIAENFLQNWLYPEISGIGAGIDSFFEYALKWYIMSGKPSGTGNTDRSHALAMIGEPEFLDVWNDSYAAIMRFARASDGLWVLIFIHSQKVINPQSLVSSCKYLFRRCCIRHIGFALCFLARATSVGRGR